VTRKLVVLAKPPKPVSQMTDDERSEFAGAIVDAIGSQVRRGADDRGPSSDPDHERRDRRTE
jgi:hypothetical protein